jgi:hypothetical protein
MAERPPGESPPEGGRPEPPAPEAQEEPMGGQAEQYGLITLARHRKDDGRELLLYRRRDGA